MKAIGQLVSAALEQPSRSTTASSSPLPSQTASSELALIQDPKGRQELSSFVAQCFEALKTYGKEPEQMVAVANMFQMVLADYPIDKIKSAFKAYLKTHSDMPAPADIAHLIERGTKPALDRSVYVELCRRHKHERFSRWTAEWEYMRDFERFQMTGKMS